MKKKLTLFAAMMTVSFAVLPAGAVALAGDAGDLSNVFVPFEKVTEAWGGDTMPGEDEGGDSYYNQEMEDVIASMSPEEIMECVNSVTSILMSDEVQDLLKYPEVKDLAQTVMERMLDMAVTEPELTSEILETMGVSREAVYLYVKIVEETNMTGSALTEFAGSEGGQQVIKKAKELASDEQVRSLLNTWYTDLLGDNSAESMSETMTE